jgi:hypothetical protein
MAAAFFLEPDLLAAGPRIRSMPIKLLAFVAAQLLWLIGIFTSGEKSGLGPYHQRAPQQPFVVFRPGQARCMMKL